jgi:hypothetical protein
MNQATPPDPSQPPSWTSDYFREPVAAGTSPLGRGLVGHVPIIAIGLIVQGALELGFALLLLFVGLMFALATDPELAKMRPMSGIMFGLAAPALACSVLRIVAGLYNWRYRGRILGMAALGVGLLTMVTCYCAPTSIGLAVYGLIVYLNDSVIAAFALGDAGKSAVDIQTAFPPGK